jgi:hypothetical protein
VFDKITLQRSIGRQPLTAGELAEALLFYKNVHIVFNETLLTKLARSIGMPALLDILARPNVSAVYCSDGVFGTSTTTIGGIQRYGFGSIQSTINQTTRKLIKDRTEIFEFLLAKRGGCSRFEAMRYARKLRPLLPFRKYASDDFVPGGISQAAEQDALDHPYVYEAVRRSLNALVPSCPPLPMFRFDVIKVPGGGFAVDSDLDFVGLTARLTPADRENGLKIGPAVLLDVIFTVRTDLTIGVADLVASLRVNALALPEPVASGTTGVRTDREVPGGCIFRRKNNQGVY